jgi:iron complex outermembrane receptor protein
VNFATDSYAQKLVDQMLDKHADVQVLEMHMAPPGSERSVIVASNIGRHGKPDGGSVVQVSDTGDRSSRVVPLHDAGGKAIGTLAVALAPKSGEDKALLQQRARDIEAEIARLIPSQAKLLEPAKN